MKTYTLDTVNGRKSFNGKCRVIEDNNVLKLLSYDTIVAEYNKNTDEVKVNGYYSQTTMSHINSFLNHVGKPKLNKKDLILK